MWTPTCGLVNGALCKTPWLPLEDPLAPIPACVSASRLVLCTYPVCRSTRAITAVPDGCQRVCHTRHIAVASPSVLVGCQRVCHTGHVAVASPSVHVGCQRVCHMRHVAAPSPSVLDGCQRVCHTRHVAAPSPSVHRALLHHPRGINTHP